MPGNTLKLSGKVREKSGNFILPNLGNPVKDVHTTRVYGPCSRVLCSVRVLKDNDGYLQARDQDFSKGAEWNGMECGIFPRGLGRGQKKLIHCIDQFIGILLCTYGGPSAVHTLAVLYAWLPPI